MIDRLLVMLGSFVELVSILVVVCASLLLLPAAFAFTLMGGIGRHVRQTRFVRSLLGRVSRPHVAEQTRSRVDSPPPT